MRPLHPQRTFPRAEARGWILPDGPVPLLPVAPGAPQTSVNPNGLQSREGPLAFPWESPALRRVLPARLVGAQEAAADLKAGRGPGPGHDGSTHRPRPGGGLDPAQRAGTLGDLFCPPLLCSLSLSPALPPSGPLSSHTSCGDLPRRV